MSRVASARGLGKRFGPKWALAHLDLEVEAGEGLLVVGDNGSGKTTLLRLLAGLLRPTVGRAEVFGDPPHKAGSPARAKLSLVSHQGHLYDAFTPLEMLEFWSRLLGRESAKSRLLVLLEEAGLAGEADTPVAGFSAGMRKRLSLLRLRLESPGLVLLDEPFSALDQAGREWLLDMVAGFKKEGVALVVASHDPQRVASLCSRVVRLDRGQSVWTGTFADWLDPPAEARAP